MIARQAQTSIAHHLQQQQSMPPYQQPQIPHMPQQHQTLEAIPLPDGWQKAYTPEGEVYYVNHRNRTTSWLHPGMAQHQHSHSFAGLSGGVGHPSHPSYAQYTRQQQHQLSLQQQLLSKEDMIRKQQLQRQEQMLQMVGNEPKTVPTTMYGDPYLSSSDHVRQASHDSGLGPTTMPYPSDVGIMDFEEGMDTSSAGGLQTSSNRTAMPPGMRGPQNRTLDYLDNLPDTHVDQEQHPGMDTDQSMGGDLLKDFGWV